MIGLLRGRVHSKQPPQLLLEVAGVGYEVEAPMSTFYELPEVGAEVELLTHLVVREDAHTLYGFATAAERELFRALIKVSGVGAKMAVGVLSGISVDGFLRCVQDRDVAALTRVPGIGKKTAERLLVEMRDRVESGQVGAASVVGGGPDDPVSEARDALLALGYKAAEVARLLKGIETDGRSSEDIIREALRSIAR